LDAGAATVLSLMTSLDTLDIEGCKLINTNSTFIEPLCNLKSINLKCVKPVHPASVIKLCNTCTQLKNINVSYCDTFSSQDLKLMIKGKCNLNFLGIDGIYKIDDPFFKEMVTECPKLKKITITNHMDISIPTLMLINKLKYLERLTITNNENFGDDIFENFLLENLVYVDCSGCVNFFDNEAIILIKKCNMLQTLIIYKTGITKKTIIDAIHQKNNSIYQCILEMFVSKSLLKGLDEKILESTSLIQVHSIDK